MTIEYKDRTTSRSNKGMVSMNTQKSVFWKVQRVLKAILPLVILIGGMSTTHTTRAESSNDILVVVNLGSNVNSLEANEVREIFLKKKTRWGSGATIVPINPANNSKLREEFRTKVLKMTASEEQTYWQSRKIKDGVFETVAFANVLKAVFKLRGAISYVYRSEFMNRVAKVLLVIPAN